MRLNKNGTPDKRFKPPEKDTPIKVEVHPTDDMTMIVHDQDVQTDPQTLFNNLLESNNLQLDFDVLEGTVTTKQGIIKLDKPTLVIKASYVQRQ